MNNVWKIGSRWGNKGTSVLDLFLRYSCVFFGGKGDRRVGKWDKVDKGDIFVVSSGKAPVAIGQAMGKFKAYRDIEFHFKSDEAGRFMDDDVVICEALLWPLREGISRQGWRIDSRKRFCCARLAAGKARSVWAENCRIMPPMPPGGPSRVPVLLEEINQRVIAATDCAYGEGALAKAREIAGYLKAKGTAIDIIAESTGLSEAEISTL